MRHFWKKVTEVHSSGAHRSWGRINTLCNLIKIRFKRNLYQNMLNNALYLEKIEKSPQRWGLCPQTSVGFWRLGALPPEVTPVSCFSYFKITTYNFILG